MENKFYVGIVFHKRKVTRLEYKEKIVLYKINNTSYLDLKKDIVYTIDSTKNDYVMEETLIETDIKEHRENYLYLLSRHKSSHEVKTKTRLKNIFFK